MLKLSIDAPPELAGVRLLKIPVTTLGRSPTNDVVLNDARVSRTHAAITVDAAFVLIEDLGSTNGVFVNDRRVATAEALVHGDRITLGSCELRFTWESQNYAQIEAEALSSIPGLRFVPRDREDTRDTEK